MISQNVKSSRQETTKKIGEHSTQKPVASITQGEGLPRVAQNSHSSSASSAITASSVSVVKREIQKAPIKKVGSSSDSLKSMPLVSSFSSSCSSSSSSLIPASVSSVSPSFLSSSSPISFSLVYPKTPFTKEGAEMLTLTLGKGCSKELFNKCFICKAGRSYYMTDDFLDMRIEMDTEQGGILNDMDFAPVLKIDNRLGYILKNPEQMLILAQRLTQNLKKLCTLEQLSYKIPQKRLDSSSIKKLRDVIVTELGLSESDVLYYSIYEDHLKQLNTLPEAIKKIIDGKARYIFCNDGLHTNLISSYQINEIQYFFILDSVGYSLTNKKKELDEGMQVEVASNKRLIEKQIQELSYFNKKIVISTETRQHTETSCAAFAREDLRVLHHYGHLHEEILKQSTQTRENQLLLTFPKFPAQMLLMYQALKERMLSDPRSKEVVVDRDGERDQLGTLTLKHSDSIRGLNMYAHTLINEFIAGAKFNILKLPSPLAEIDSKSGLLRARAPQVRAISNSVSSSSLTSSKRSLIEDGNADVSVFLPTDSPLRSAAAKRVFSSGVEQLLAINLLIVRK